MSTDFFEDYATEPVPHSISVGGLRIGLVNGALAFSVPGIVTGLEIGGSLPIQESIFAFCLGGLLLAILGAITGIVGQRNRLTTCMTITCVFGRGGAAIINFLIALSLLGWYGVQMDLFSDAIGLFVESWTGRKINIVLIEILGGLAITATTMFGFKLMNQLSSWLVPIMVVVICYMAYRVSMFPPSETILEQSLSFGDSVTIIIGSFIVGVVLMPDFTRFAGTTTNAIVPAFIAFFLLSTLVYIVSAMAAAKLATINAVEVLTAIGMGTSALALILVSSYLSNVVNLYGAGLGINAIAPNLKEHHIIAVAGLLGTIAASMDILTRFTDFLYGLAIVFAPIAGVYIVDFFVIRRMKKYEIEEIQTGSFLNLAAFLAWVVGMFVSLSSQRGMISILNLEAVEATIAAMLFYWLFRKLGVSR